MNLAKVAASSVVGALLTLSGCAQLKDIYQGGTTPPTSTASSVSGTVQAVDAQSHTITIAASPTTESTLRSTETVVLSFDSATVVTYQNQQYAPTDLETGDQIQSTAEKNGALLMARNIAVLSSVSATSTPSTPDLRNFTATVRAVSSNNRTLELAPAGGGAPVVISFDDNTTVDYQGERYRPDDLERGDEIRVATRRTAAGTIAERIDVVRNVSVNGTATPVDSRQLRGTVQTINATAHTIELKNVAWMQGFNPDAGGISTYVKYDGSTVVMYQGKQYTVANLEPGDVIDIEAVGQKATLVARRIVVAKGS